MRCARSGLVQVTKYIRDRIIEYCRDDVSQRQLKSFFVNLLFGLMRKRVG
jgi:hypothetical protein